VICSSLLREISARALLRLGLAGQTGLPPMFSDK
jgi:hypothetical protein